MERFTAVTIATVTGYSVATINSWASKYNKTVKDGLTLPEILDFLHAPKRESERGKVDRAAAQRLRTALEVMGEGSKDFELKG